MIEQVTVSAERAFDHFVRALDGTTVEKVEINRSAYKDDARIEIEGTYCVHPVFAFTRHYRSNDDGNAGYTNNPYRGDHVSIPFYGEDDEIGAIDVSFHKGDPFVSAVLFKGPDLSGARTILHMWETR